MLGGLLCLESSLYRAFPFATIWGFQKQSLKQGSKHKWLVWEVISGNLATDEQRLLEEKEDNKEWWWVSNLSGQLGLNPARDLRSRPVSLTHKARELQHLSSSCAWRLPLEYSLSNTLACLLLFSCSVVSDSAAPRTAACQASLFITNSRSLLKLMFTDSVMPSNHLILCRPPSPPAFDLSQHQGLFQWVSSSYQVAKVLGLQHQSFQWIFRIDFL